MSPRLIRVGRGYDDVWNRKHSCYLGDDNWPFRSLPAARRPTNFSKLWEIRRCARAGHTMFTSSSLFRAPLSIDRGDENGIRYAIVASHDDNHGSLSLMNLDLRDRGRDSVQLERIPSFIVRRINIIVGILWN